MRKYLVPLLLFSAIGAVIIVLVNYGDDDAPRELPAKKTKAESTVEPTDEVPKSYLAGGGRKTPTKLERNKWLSELERVLARGDLSNAHYYRAKLCENINSLMEDDVLVRNLLDAIRKYAIESRDPEMRKLLLPILRVLTTPEATKLIEEEYYRTTEETERLILLDAMANPEHNPDTAGVWAAEMAINSDDIEHRQAAFLFIQNLPIDRHEVVVRTAKQIYDSSTRPEQKVAVIVAITQRAEDSETGREFLRERLRDPRETELAAVISYIEGWAGMREALVLESLATQFPAMQEFLRERAEKIRTMHATNNNPERAKEITAELEAQEAERRRREKE